MYNRRNGQSEPRTQVKPVDPAQPAEVIQPPDVADSRGEIMPDVESDPTLPTVVYFAVDPAGQLSPASDVPRCVFCFAPLPFADEPEPVCGACRDDMN